MRSGFSPIQTDDRVIYLVFKAQQKLRSYLKTTFALRGIKVTPVQAGILFLLKKKDGQTMSQLSQLLDLDNSTTTGLVDRLQKSGFVERRVSLTDRRISRIYMTHEGMGEMNRAKDIVREVNETIKSGFSEGDMETFKRVLHSFFEKFGHS